MNLERSFFKSVVNTKKRKGLGRGFQSYLYHGIDFLLIEDVI